MSDNYFGFAVCLREPYNKSTRGNPKRAELWGFGLGDRVRVIPGGVAEGIIGKVAELKGCALAGMDPRCRDHCPIVGIEIFSAPKEYTGRFVTKPAPRRLLVVPARLEHID